MGGGERAVWRAQSSGQSSATRTGLGGTRLESQVELEEVWSGVQGRVATLCV